MLRKSVIQFSVDGQGCVLARLFTWGQTMVEVMKMMATSLQRSHACTAASVPQPCSGPPLTHASAGDSWTRMGKSGSVSGDHCSFLLGPCAHKVFFVPSKILFPQICVCSGRSMVRLMAISSQRA